MVPSQRPVITTLTNSGYRELTLNLYLSMQAIGMKDVLHIGCIDLEAKRWLAERAPLAHVFLLDVSERRTDWVTFDSSGWKEVTYNKFLVIHPILASGRDVVFLDGDIVLLRDPIPSMKKSLKDADAIGGLLLLFHIL